MTSAKGVAHSEEWIATLRLACEKLAGMPNVILTVPESLPVPQYVDFWAEVASNLPSGLRLANTGYRDCGATRFMLRAE
jgi:hypothetical protein